MDPLVPSSFNHKFVVVNGNRIHYVDEGNSNKVVVCVHGFPDLWYGWRYQIPYLVSLGYRVIVPDVRGYGQTDSPKVENKDIQKASTKSLLGDIIGVLDHEKINRAVWLGHDWGGSLVWRAALWFPSYVIAVGAVCTPYSPTPSDPVRLSDIVVKHKNWLYQAWFRTRLAIEDLNSNTELFLTSVFRPYTDMARSSVFSTTVPLNQRTITSVKGIKRSSLISQAELDYYVSEYKRHGFEGPLNQYKTHEVNWQEEYNAGFVGKVITVPTLMVTVGNDPALPASFTKNMPNYLPNLTFRHVEHAGHWVLVEQTNEVNPFFKEFLSKAFHPNKL
ncbi:Bifunctional epoxide hydrolase 2 [Smittium culicis]|uniref:Bifunctional epoxide hydrolase 2 n=1 Tax=Smittium culicis TaxID=133412 RepID=A0A1R1YQW8_9FUNG|nr:Bifunctional epoxide hydrolase 2 [Smittium culicis]